MDIFGLGRIANYIFPVLIYNRDEQLTIEDRRPNLDLLLTALGVLICLGFLAFYTLSLFREGIYWLIILIGAMTLFSIYRLLTRDFREVYFFDKTTDTHRFIRQSVLKKEILEGDLQQFRAVQVEKTIVTSDQTSYEMYRVVLLRKNELLFGQPDTYAIRLRPPLFSNWEAELRIASAISGFLNVRIDDCVDVMSFR